MTKDMTTGSPLRIILLFSIPVLLGNLFQQFYNMVDTIIVGRYLGEEALAAVGSTGCDVSCARFCQRHRPGLRRHGFHTLSEPKILSCSVTTWRYPRFLH